MKVNKTFSIADISILLNTESDIVDLHFDSSLCYFYDKQHILKNNIKISSVESLHVDFTNYFEIYDNFPYYLWKMWKAKDESSYLILLFKDRNGLKNSPSRILIVNNNFSDVQILNVNGNMVPHPLYYLLTLILIGYSNINKIGFLLHSAMVMIDGSGYLFSGVSEAGKTTLSKLWLQDKDAEVITDERVIVREKDGLLYAFGTPWYGTASIHKNKGVPIHKIFFIRHGSENTLKKLSTIEAANRVMVRCFPAFWHKEGMRFALDFCARIASEINCYEFGFVPDSSAVEFIKKTVR